MSAAQLLNPKAESRVRTRSLQYPYMTDIWLTVFAEAG